MCTAISSHSQCIRASAFDSILITSGYELGEAPACDVTEPVLLGYAEATGIGVFGVCRGLQSINAHLLRR